MCVGLLRAAGLQDVSADVVATRANTIASLLSDPAQISAPALGNCTTALAQIILDNPSLTADSSVARQCVNALSSVLGLGSALPISLLALVNAAMDKLTAAMQSQLVVGEPPQTIVTANARVSTSVVADISSVMFTPPQSPLDVFNQVPVTTIALDPLAASVSSALGLGLEPIGVSVVQYASLPSGSTSASIGVGLQLTSYTTNPVTGARRARRLLSSSTSDVGVTVTLQNMRPADYTSYAASNGTVACPAGSVASTVAVSCRGNGGHSVTCPASTTGGSVRYSCPSQRTFPVCTSWNEAAMRLYLNGLDGFHYHFRKLMCLKE